MQYVTDKIKKVCMSLIIITAMVTSVCACGKGNSTSTSGQDNEEANTLTKNPVKDDEENLMQREFLFSHLDLNMDDYEITDSMDTDDGILKQWWYCGVKNSNDGVYIAVGNLAQNGNEPIAAFGDSVAEIDPSMDYILEISTGTLDENGFMDMDMPIVSYYFVQQGEDIAFMSRK